MGYLQLKHNLRLIFDPTYPDIDQTAFPSYDWMEFYGNMEEAIPPNMPSPLGKDVDLRMMVDSDHACFGVMCIHIMACITDRDFTYH